MQAQWQAMHDARMVPGAVNFVVFDIPVLSLSVKLKQTKAKLSNFLTCAISYLFTMFWVCGCTPGLGPPWLVELKLESERCDYGILLNRNLDDFICLLLVSSIIYNNICL